MKEHNDAFRDHRYSPCAGKDIDMAQIKCPNCSGTGWIDQPEYAPPPDWEDEAYLVRYPDVEKAAANPLTHWFEHGKAEGRKYMPDGWSSAGYLAKYRDIRDSAYYSTHPLEHYWRHGKHKEPQFMANAKDKETRT